MRYAVVGTERFFDYEKLCTCLNAVLDKMVDIVITGESKGTDEFVKMYCEERKIFFKTIKLNEKNGKDKFLIRNREIVNNAESVIVFWDGYSARTGFIIAYAAQNGKNVVVIGVGNGTKDIVSSGKEEKSAQEFLRIQSAKKRTSRVIQKVKSGVGEARGTDFATEESSMPILRAETGNEEVLEQIGDSDRGDEYPGGEE